MGLFDFDYVTSFLHPERGYKSAEAPINQGYEEAKGYLDPYFQHGNEQYSYLNDAASQLMNPADLENKWASSFELSPFAQRLLQINKEQGLEDASSMGLMGSSAALSNIQRGAGDIVASQRRQYMQDLMDKFLKGIGLRGDIYSQGLGAGTNLANLASNRAENLANLEYGRVNAPGMLYEKLLGTAIPMLSGGYGNTTGGMSGNQFNTGRGSL